MEELKWLGEIVFGPYGGAFSFGLVVGGLSVAKLGFQYVVKYQREKIDELQKSIAALNEKILDIVRRNS